MISGLESLGNTALILLIFFLHVIFALQTSGGNAVDICMNTWEANTTKFISKSIPNPQIVSIHST